MTLSLWTSVYPEYVGMLSTPPGITLPANRWTAIWQIELSVRELCAQPWKEREKRPHPLVLACFFGMVIALNAPWIAFCAGQNSRRMAGRNEDTIRILTDPRCLKKDMWPLSRA